MFERCHFQNWCSYYTFRTWNVVGIQHFCSPDTWYANYDATHDRFGQMKPVKKSRIFQVWAFRYRRSGMGVQVWASRYGRPSMGVQVWAFRYGRPGMGVQVWAFKYGRPSMGVQVWASRYGRSSMGVQVWASKSDFVTDNEEGGLRHRRWRNPTSPLSVEKSGSAGIRFFCAEKPVAIRSFFSLNCDGFFRRNSEWILILLYVHYSTSCSQKFMKMLPNKHVVRPLLDFDKRDSSVALTTIVF